MCFDLLSFSLNLVNYPSNSKCTLCTCSTRAERAETQRTGIPESRPAQVISSFFPYTKCACLL